MPRISLRIHQHERAGCIRDWLCAMCHYHPMAYPLVLAVDTHGFQCKVSPLHYISASTNTAEDCLQALPAALIRD